MINLKTHEEIEIMKEGGAILSKVMSALLPQIKEDMTTEEIDTLAEGLIKKQRAEPSFKKVKGYKWTTCVPVNEQVVHTPPSQKKLKKGDLLTVDIGVFHKGFHTDYATSFVIGGTRDPHIEKFLAVGQEALDLAIKKAVAGSYLGEISKIIQEKIYGNGYFILKELTGHGIGRQLHEDPFVPGFLKGPVTKTYKIQPGLVIAIEVIYSMGTEEIAYEQAGEWSIISADHSLTACFEKTVAILQDRTYILT